MLVEKGSKIDELINLLEGIRSGLVDVVTTVRQPDEDFDEEENKFVGRHFIEQGDEREYDDLCCTVLIAPGGKVHWNNVKILRSKGFDVFAIESDSFGWLIGGVETGKGIITYG